MKLKKQFLIGPLALFVMMLATVDASADSLVFTTTYGGHSYELWDSLAIHWSDARAAAVADGGYLAVFTDAAETSSVYADLIGHGFFQPGDSQGIQAWLGGYTADLSGSTTDPSNWAWVTGEAWTAFDAANFAAGEPNGDSEGLSINRFGTFKWNDEGGFVGGYIVEKASSVPEGGSILTMLGMGLAGLAVLRRKSN